jgi:hypothetical protein
MRLVRLIFALLLAAAFPLAANECLLAASFPSHVADCCDHGSAPTGNVPEGSDCANCLIMDSGANPVTAQIFAAGATEWREDVLLSDRVRLALAVVENGTPVLMPESPPEERPLWHLVARTASPVRGPSFA